MATRRYRQGLAHYRPRTAASAFPKKRGPRPDSAEGRRVARKAAARGRLPKPGSAAAKRRMWSYLPDTEEVRWLHQASLSVTLDKRHSGPNPYHDDLEAMAEAAYRKAYNAQAREKRATKPKGPNVRSPWIWVRRHRRRRPG